MCSDFSLNKYTNMCIRWDIKTAVYFQETKNFTSFSSTVRARYNQIDICNKIRIKIYTLLDDVKVTNLHQAL